MFSEWKCSDIVNNFASGNCDLKLTQLVTSHSDYSNSNKNLLLSLLLLINSDEQQFISSSSPSDLKKEDLSIAHICPCVCNSKFYLSFLLSLSQTKKCEELVSWYSELLSFFSKEQTFEFYIVLTILCTNKIILQSIITFVKMNYWHCESRYEISISDFWKPPPHPIF